MNLDFDMIAYDLRCAHGHTFEAWFPSSDAFEAQVRSSGICCPVCDDRAIAKAPMAPFVARTSMTASSDASSSDGGDPGADASISNGNPLSELRQYVETHFTDVGSDFPEEARKIHFGEVESRTIFGEASEADARGLVEDGIGVQRLPWLRRRDD